jgi:hypothetical protein
MWAKASPLCIAATLRELIYRLISVHHPTRMVREPHHDSHFFLFTTSEAPGFIISDGALLLWVYKKKYRENTGCVL